MDLGIYGASVAVWTDGEPPKEMRDGRMLLLIVCYEDDGDQGCDEGATDDVVRYWRTMGFNNCENLDGEPGEWQMVGWNWCNDVYCEGPKRVRIVKWMEFPDAPEGFGRDDG